MRSNNHCYSSPIPLNREIEHTLPSPSTDYTILEQSLSLIVTKPVNITVTPTVMPIVTLTITVTVTLTVKSIVISTLTLTVTLPPIAMCKMQGRPRIHIQDTLDGCKTVAICHQVSNC